MDRRSLILTLLAFASLTLVVVLGSSVVRCVERSEAEPAEDEASGSVPVAAPAQPDAASLEFLGPLAENTKFEGWTITRVDPRHEGALPLVIESAAGEQVELDVRRLDPRSPPPIASTPSLAIYVRGREISDTAREGSEALARALGQREAALGTLAGLEALVD